ncbi:MAG: InlB B-repeat-containing protein [Clostridia bacterium]|nr:InlB B-repeat-containing protein [Clostridia bacterium]
MKNFKRILAAVLCVMTFVSVLPLTASAAYANTHVNTGNQIEDLIAVATTQIGYTEGNTVAAGTSGTTGGSGNYTKYGAWYGINPGAWCAMYVSWCANQAGISSSIIPKHASCDIGMQTFQQRGRWQWSPACGGGYVPKRGDIIYFRTKTNQVTDSTHVGIVYNCDGSKVYTLEGNASNKCQTKSYALSSAYILGYGTPNYTSGSAGYAKGQYKVTASSLNMRDAASSSGTNVLQALPTNAVVDVTLVQGNWGYCSYNGISGWIHLGYTIYLGTSSGGGTTTTTYTITFDPGSGTLATGASSYKISTGMPYAQVMADMPTATRNGYRFDGWYCAKYAYTFNINDTFSVSEDVTLTAIWTPVYGVYEVTASYLNMRAGAGSSYESVQVLANGNQINVTKIDDKWGYGTFNGISGWFSLNYCVYVGEGFEGYILTFNTNGGTMPEGYVTTYEFLADEKFSEVIWGFPVPTKEGYEFKGWSWSEDSGHFWTDGWGTQPYTFGKNITLDAVWSAHTCVFTKSGTTAATCTEEGVTTYSCTCGESYTETTPAVGHKFESTTTAATCTAEGKTLTVCSRCGEASTTTIAALGHNWGAWTVTKAPTALTDGVETRTCSRCGAKETREVSSTKTYKISFDPDGGVMPAGTSTVYGINYQENYKDATGIEYPVPTLDGYVFDGWYWEAYNYVLEEGTWNTGYFAVQQNVEFVALWSEDPNFVPDDGATKIAGVNNYTITMKNMTNIKEVRFAIGTYTTGSAVKAAEKNVTMDAATVAKYTVDGTMTYDLPWVGTYTFWVRYNDGTSVFLYTDVTDITPYVTSYGVKLTVNDFGENYKDAWLAKGTFNSYSEIKASTAFKYQASANKLANYAKTTHDFTYTMEDPGDYTVLIRYNDGSFDVIHHTLTVTTPVLVENGLQAIITNIPDIKIIRTAYGHYTSVADIKNASTVRYFNNKTAIKDAQEYMIQYREEGEVTIIVEYNDGYKHYFYYNVAKKVPTMVQTGNKVTFGNLDDMYIIRYAPGKYTTAGNIKNAPGAQYVKADAINQYGEIDINNLTSGRWSFMVQYNDDSYNFYVLDIE